MTTSRVLVITVNFHTEAMIARLADSLADQTVPFDFVIIDNGSDQQGAAILRTVASSIPTARVVDYGENLGYFGAVNSYLDHEKADPLPDWIVVTNPDVVCQPDFLERLVTVDADVVAPRMTHSGTGRDLNPFLMLRPSPRYARSRKVIFATRFTAQSWILASALRAKLLGGRSPTLSQTTIYAGHGSLLAFRRSYFDSGGSLRHPPFLFGEEFTVAEQVRRFGGAVVYAPDVRAQHVGHVATGLFRSSRMLRYQREASIYIDQLIGGDPGLSAATPRLPAGARHGR